MVTNISTYRFAPLTDLKALRQRLQSQCKSLNLKGTILISTEGINLFVAGEPNSVDRLVNGLRKIPGLEDLEPKVSLSEHQPFNRMLVRIKKEIIAFGVEGIDPARYTSPRIKPAELKKWFDEGRDFVMLDTRNDYEIKLGTFEKALPIGVNHFRDFPKAVSELPESLKEKTIVSFCTGGIRCEKAAPYLESQGFKNVFQLDGGILKYFEEVGKDHYDRACFVFDQRVGVDPTLKETSDKQCFACLAPLTQEELKDPRYVLGESCPYCFLTNEEKMNEVLRIRHAEIARVTNPLPGSAPYRQERPLRVPEAFQEKSALEFLSGILRHIEAGEWEKAFSSGLILGPNRLPITPDTKVLAGEYLFHLIPNTAEPDVNADIQILFEDEAILVLNKPAPLPVHPCGRFNRNTLQNILNLVYHPQKPHAAHRLDSNTTGVLVVTRTKHCAGILQPQFADGKVEKLYLARIHGHPTENLFTCDLALAEETEAVGARRACENGLPAKTEFRVLTRFSDGTSLLEVRPFTGRTNQIRIHLWELGFPIVGDPLFLPKKNLGEKQTSAVGDAPLCLHAKSISFMHPVSKRQVRFSAPDPKWTSGIN